ncbi:putative bacitracin synthetase [Streptococcus mutans 3SN1]|nr:putative bacitracin synthetase [Streptococcus mutans 3SN1]
MEGQSILLDLSNTRALAGEAGIELPDIKRIVQKMINN